MLLCVLTCVVPAFAEPSVRIARFDGDRDAAISYTFDDGLRDQYTLAVPMLNETGFKGTFFVIPGRVSETVEDAEQRQNDKRAWGTIIWDELREMAGQGHEIASHTWTHPNLTKLSAEEVDAQFSQANDAIEKEIGQAPLTQAYPFNARTPEVEEIASKHYIACRTFQTGFGGKRSSVEWQNRWADRLVEEHEWGVAMIHAIGNGYAAFEDPEAFRAHLHYVQERASSIWVDTFANIARYIQERNQTTLSVAGDPGALVCTLNCPLDPTLYSVPLTLVIEAPNVRTARAVHDGQELPVQILEETLLVKAVPGGEPIRITWR